MDCRNKRLSLAVCCALYSYVIGGGHSEGFQAQGAIVVSAAVRNSTTHIMDMGKSGSEMASMQHLAESFR